MWFNPIMIWLIRSPFHGFVSKGMALLTYTGRKSKRMISTPVNYLRDGNMLWLVSWRDRTWWKNLRGGAKVQVLLAGKSVGGNGHVIEEKGSVAKSLLDYYGRIPQYAKYVGIGLDATGQPIPADCERAAEKMVMVRVELDTLE